MEGFRKEKKRQSVCNLVWATDKWKLWQDAKSREFLIPVDSRIGKTDSEWRTDA